MQSALKMLAENPVVSPTFAPGSRYQTGHGIYVHRDPQSQVQGGRGGARDVKDPYHYHYVWYGKKLVCLFQGCLTWL